MKPESQYSHCWERPFSVAQTSKTALGAVPQCFPMMLAYMLKISISLHDAFHVPYNLVLIPLPELTKCALCRISQRELDVSSQGSGSPRAWRRMSLQHRLSGKGGTGGRDREGQGSTHEQALPVLQAPATHYQPQNKTATSQELT